jgi:hypothetical protein
VQKVAREVRNVFQDSSLRGYIQRSVTAGQCQTNLAPNCGDNLVSCELPAAKSANGMELPNLAAM